jgi:hypothetical protein
MQGRQTAGGAKLQSKRGFMGRKIGCRDISGVKRLHRKKRLSGREEAGG